MQGCSEFPRTAAPKALLGSTRRFLDHKVDGQGTGLCKASEKPSWQLLNP